MMGWRYFAKSVRFPERVVAADISAGPAPVLINTSYGPEAADEYNRRRHAESIPPVQGETFELRTLRIPSGLLQCIWVKPVSSNGYIVQVGRTFVPVNREQPFYPIETYLGVVKTVGVLPGKQPNPSRSAY
jgi:hypothetical protein